MTRQIKIIFAILFGFNVLLTVEGIVIGVSFSEIALSLSTAIWIAIYYNLLKTYTELENRFTNTLINYIEDATRAGKRLKILKEALTREWASPEEFEKWKEEKTKELFKDEND